MENKFEFLGDEFRHLSENNAEIRFNIILSFFEPLKDIIVGYLRINIHKYPQKKMEIIISEIFKDDGLTQLMASKESAIFNLSKFFAKTITKFETCPKFITTDEINWYGKALSDYFRSQKMPTTYSCPDTHLKITW